MYSISKIALVLLFVTVVYSASIQKRDIQDNDITKRNNNEDVQKAIDELSGQCGGQNNDGQGEVEFIVPQEPAVNLPIEASPIPVRKE